MKAPLHTYVFLAAGLTMFAFAPIMVRGAGADADPVAITTIRTVSAFLMVLPFWIVIKIRDARALIHLPETEPRPDSMTRSEVAWGALAGFFLAVHFMLWIGSLFYTSVASASVLVTVHPIMLIVVESLFLKKKFSIASWTGVIIAFSGSVILGVFDHAPNESFSNPILGNSMAFAAAILFVFYILISQKIRKKSGWLDYVTVVYGFTALTCVIIAFLLGSNWWVQPQNTVLAGVGLAIGASIMGHGSMNYAVKFISATLLSTLILAEPVFATLLAFYFFQELPGTGSLVAMGVIMAGIFMTWWFRKRDLERRSQNFQE